MCDFGASNTQETHTDVVPEDRNSLRLAAAAAADVENAKSEKKNRNKWMCERFNEH